MTVAAANPDSSIRWSECPLSQSSRGAQGAWWIASCRRAALGEPDQMGISARGALPVHRSKPGADFGFLLLLAPRRRLGWLYRTRVLLSDVTLTSLRVAWSGLFQRRPTRDAAADTLLSAKWTHHQRSPAAWRTRA